jgi:hypothetical protein
MRASRYGAIAALLLLLACEQVQEHVVLSPAGAQVEFAAETPSDSVYTMIGPVTGQAAGKNIQEAEVSARNDTRNKAAAMGATLVVIDEDNGSLVRFQDMQEVTIKGRAFKMTP